MWKLVLAVAIALVMGAAIGQSETVYRWVDAQGNVHYSDHPHPGAAKVTLPQTQTFASPMTAKARAPEPPSPAAPTADYSQFSLASPANEATLWYMHEVTVSVALVPQLRPGDTITFHLDGKTIGPTEATSVTFKDVDRGEHTASAELNAVNGASLKTGTVTFYIRQKSILAPKPPD
ncbi:MAG: DUF4124 domain-containing protein [Gammaproteobacteria bacterium]